MKQSIVLTLLLGTHASLALKHVRSEGRPSVGDGRALKKSKGGSEGLVWSACADLDPFYGLECATLEVPRDYSKPDGKQISLALSRRLHTIPDDYKGIMLTNPGGPGDEGRIFAILQEFIPGDVGFKYDWYGFDVRGSGASEPFESCDPDFLFDIPRPPYEPISPDTEQEWLDRSKKYAEGCADENEKLLRHMSTETHVRDMESIRLAVEADLLNFYGFSYGTALGQVYAQLFPDTTGRFILDGLVDQTRLWYEGSFDIEYAFIQNFQKWLEWVAQYDSVYQLGTTAEEVLEKFQTGYDEVLVNPAQGAIGAAEWMDIFSLVGNTYEWIYGAEVLSEWIVNDNETALVDAFYYVAEEESSYTGYLSIVCRENAGGPRPTNYENAKLDYDRAFKDGAAFMWFTAWSVGPCLEWPTEQIEPVPILRNYETEMLLTNTEFDYATPYRDALAVREVFRKSVLVGTPGGLDHAESFDNPCVLAIIGQYMDDGTLPERSVARNGNDAECPSLSLPVPRLPTSFDQLAKSQEVTEDDATLSDGIKKELRKKIKH